jgi:hypothetical protein
MFQAENYTDGNIVQVIADASSPGTGRILLQASHGSNYVAVTVLPETDEDPGCIYLSSYGGTINPNNVLGIKGVANPIDPTDAANKAYVDSQVAANAFHIANHDLTPQLDGSKTVFNIDASIKATSVIIATYAGQVLVPGVNYSIDATAHTLTYLGTPPDSNENRYLILLVIDIGS